MFGMRMPVYEAIREYISLSPTTFHMPGHKLGKGIPAELRRDLAMLDLTEIPGTDNLHYPQGAIMEAQELAAETFGADRTFFLVNGSTCGVQAAIMSICSRGDKLIVARDCHKSAIGGMMLAGASPVYIKPGFDNRFGIPSVISLEDLRDALEKNRDAVAVFITRPNYYGLCCDISSIAEMVHSYGMMLIVDEAHGAHLGFNKMLPESAMKSGADICVQSAHKTLPAFTQGAYLHTRGQRVDLDRLKFTLSLLQTSSPSYVIMTFLDMARAVMQTRGKELLDGLLKDIEYFAEAMNEIKNMELVGNYNLMACRHDKTRLVVNTKKLGIAGFELEKVLRREYNIQVEMSDLYNIVCIATLSDGREDFEMLARSLGKISGMFNGLPVLADIYIEDAGIPPMAIELGEIMRYKSVKRSLDKAEGSISRGMITPYPPGIPVVCPGEVITGEAVEYLKNIINSGGNVNGLDEKYEVEVVKL